MSEVNWAEAAATVTDSKGVVPDHTKSRDTTSPKERFEKFAEKTKLGANKAARSPVRKLTEADRQKIEDFYAGISLAFVMPTPLFNQDAAEACASQAKACADAWYRLAENNDAVRRVVLMFIEGGAWGALVTAHLPIALAFLPQATKDHMGRLFTPVEVPDSPEGI